MQNLRWIYRLWQDPLSFAFHLKRGGRPIGFIFGGFGTTGETVLLLNGVYLKRQRMKVRSAALSALEAHLARPLGIRRIGVASQHGGFGPLPDDYKQTTEVVTRLRALRSRGGSLEHKVYDDISNRVNECCEMELHWRSLTN
jgi:hypothetical protein